MFNKNILAPLSFLVGTSLVACATVGQTATEVAPVQSPASPVMIDASLLPSLSPEGKVVIQKELDNVEIACNKAYSGEAVKGSATIFQFTGPEGKVMSYAMCLVNDPTVGLKRVVVQFGEVGQEPIKINEDLREVRGTDASGRPISELGYVSDGVSVPMVEFWGDGSSIIRAPDGRGVMCDSPTTNTVRTILEVGVIGVDAGSAWTDTPPAPTGTVTAENGSVIPSTVGAPIPRETSTPPQPTAEASRFTAEKVGVIPKNMAEAGQCVAVADPIKEPAKFTADVNSVLEAAQPLIDTYTGPFLQVGGFGANGIFLQVTQDMGVVGCVSFPVEEGKTGVGLVIPFQQPDGTKTAIVGVLDPFQVNLSEKQARAPDDVLAEIARTGVIQYDPSTGWNEFGFGIESRGNPEYYSNFARKYLASRTNFSADYMDCAINRKNISRDVRALLLTNNRK